MAEGGLAPSFLHIVSLGYAGAFQDVWGLCGDSEGSPRRAPQRDNAATGSHEFRSLRRYRRRRGEAPRKQGPGLTPQT